MGWLTWFTIVCHPSLVVSCHVAIGTVVPISHVNSGEGEACQVAHLE